jgi:hypothetical protein
MWFGKMMAVSDTIIEPCDDCGFLDCCKFCGNELCSCLDPDINPDSPNYGLVMLNMEEWEHHFKPIKNHLDLTGNASFDGIMFETYEHEYDYVAAIGGQNPNKIWTLVDAEDGETIIINGWAFVGRVGYFITEVPYDDMLDIVVYLDPDRD